jgi:glutathionylspermidine synthase
MENKMEFEFIDESEIVSARGFSSDRIKKTPSIFDTPLEDRTYWGNDPGSEITKIFARMEIRKAIKQLYLMDIEFMDRTRRLSKEDREELRIYQLEMLHIMMEGKTFTLRQVGCDYRIVITSK